MTTRPGKPKRASEERLLGFDLVRLVAIGVVALVHLLAVSDVPSEHWFLRLHPDQFGLAVLCTISGYFAFRSASSTPLRWLRRRITRIYVPYWIALVAVLAANAAVHYKPASFGLVVSQFLGTASFTHKGQLIGVHFWFITLILSCYAVATVVKFQPKILPLVAALFVVGVWCKFIWAGYFLAFLIGAIVAAWYTHRAILLIILLVATGLATTIHGAFTYPFVGACGLGVAFLIHGQSSPSWSRASQASYHFYLVHGPCYLGMNRLVGTGILGTFAIGTGAAILATLALQATERRIHIQLRNWGLTKQSPQSQVS